MKISEVSEFSILLYTQNWKLWNLRNMSLLSISDSSYKSRFKNDKNMNWAKNRKVPIWLKRKKKNFRDFQVFDFALHPKSKTRKSRKDLFYLIFITLLNVVALKELFASKNQSVRILTNEKTKQRSNKKRIRTVTSAYSCWTY